MGETKKDLEKLGRRKNKWTKEEEEALLAGINKHGAGKWMEILDDPDFAVHLIDRNNVNLKDKWRNLKRSMTQTVESPSISISPAESSSVCSNEPSLFSSSDESSYYEIVLDAISAINDEYGSDLNAILGFIEEQYEVPQNFIELLSDSMRILVSQGKLEKVVNRYKISSQAKNKELELAVEEVARIIAVSDEKMFIAAEAIRKAEYAEELAEESHMVLKICLEIQKQCNLKNQFF